MKILIRIEDNTYLQKLAIFADLKIEHSLYGITTYAIDNRDMYIYWLDILEANKKNIAAENRRLQKERLHVPIN